MDALEFARERRRMCNAHKRCVGCDLRIGCCLIGAFGESEENDKRVIAAVEKWSKEHPKKTRQTELLKLFPNTPLDKMGVVNICPRRFGDRDDCPAAMDTTVCNECKEKWWGEVIE